MHSNFCTAHDNVVKGAIALEVEDGDTKGGVVAAIAGRAADGRIAYSSEEGDLRVCMIFLLGVRSLGTH